MTVAADNDGGHEGFREYPALTMFHTTLLSSCEKLARVSTESREEQFSANRAHMAN